MLAHALTTTTLVPVVHVKDGKVFANSRDVAAFFRKAHSEVLRDIRRIAETLSGEISPVWFQATTWEQKTGFGFRSMPAVDMTRDGFTLLVMGYTGKTAMDFKVRYIQQFNAMEEALRNPAPALPDFTNRSSPPAPGPMRSRSDSSWRWLTPSSRRPSPS